MNISPTSSPTAIAGSSPAGIRSLGADSTRADEAGGSGGAFKGALDSVSQSLADADNMSQQVATGQITDLSQLTAAAAKAELAVQLTVAFRDRAVDSFNQIMQMQV